MAEYLTEKEFNELPTEQDQADLPVDDWEETMQLIASKNTRRISIPRNNEFTRKDVVKAFTNAFELIGGTPRLALWAHQNESDFFKLYARLLPSQASSALGETNELVIRHILPRGPLDNE